MKNYSEISAYYNNGTGAYTQNTMGWTSTLKRADAFPVETYSIFPALSVAEQYAAGTGEFAGLPYEGQVIAVTDNGIQKVYVLDSTMPNGLRQLAAGDDASHIQELLDAEVSNRISVDNLLSGAISSEVEARIADVNALSDAITAEADLRATADEMLSTNLSISLSSVDGTGGILKTYTITQGTTTVGTIDIPKDFLVKSAELCTVTEADVPYDGAEVGDKYIDFTINTPGDDETATHVYLPVKDLVDVYTGAATDTVAVTVGADNSISAVVRDGSILSAHLANNAVTSDKILSSAVTTVKIADGAVTEAKIHDDAVTTSKIADGNITLAKLSTDVTDYIDGVGTNANSYTDTAIEGLTASFTGSTSKTITAMSQANGVVSLTATNIEIAASQVSDFNDAVNGIVGSYVPLSVAETASASNKLQTKQNVDDAISAAIDALDYVEQTVPAGQMISAISETNGVVAVRTGAISINTNQITDIDSKLADYVLTAYTEGTPSVDDKLQTKSKVTTAINTAISSLDVDSIAIGAGKTLASIGEVDGKISAETTDIAITTSQVTDFDEKVKAIAGDYVPLSVASNSASDSNKLQTASEVSAIAEAYASDYATSAVNSLDVASIAVGADKTLVSLGEVDGKISAEAVAIQIAQSQVTDLTSDLTSITADIAQNASDITSLQSTKLDKSEFSTLSNQIGLSAANANNPVVTRDDIADLAGAMHFRGAVTPNDGETDREALARAIADPASGDIAIITTSSKEYVYNGTDWIELGDEILYATKAEVSAINEQLEAADEVLSAAIDNKIFIDGQQTQTLSAFHVSQDEYHAKVVAGTILSNELYIVSSDYINAYGEQIRNVAAPELSDDAATKDYVDTAVAGAVAETTELSGKVDYLTGIALSGVTLNGTAFDVASNVASLTVEVIAGGNANA